MKRLCTIFILFCILLSGCAGTETPQNPIRFYYCREDISYRGTEGVICYELRESAGRETDHEALLQEYFMGPHSDHLSPTFPHAMTLKSFSVSGTGAEIVLSDRLAELKGIRLSVACGCIARTVMDLTGAESVRIRTENALLDNAKVITIDRNNLLLTDEYDKE